MRGWGRKEERKKEYMGMNKNKFSDLNMYNVYVTLLNTQALCQELYMHNLI